MSRNIADRFPGATVLGEAEFASLIVGGVFRYREVGSEVVVERPKEGFVEGGQYRIHGLRTVSYETYSIERGTVSIACADCRYTFLGLGWERIFFRHQGRLFMANADGDGSIVELIREPPMPAGLDRRPLSASALRALLSDVNVTPVQPADLIISHPWGEIFRATAAMCKSPIEQGILARSTFGATRFAFTAMASSGCAGKSFLAEATHIYSSIRRTAQLF